LTMGREINHIELDSKNLMETKRFYSRLFRWRFEPFGDKYMMFRTGKKASGGGFNLAKKVAPSSIRFYVNVDSIPQTQQMATKLGGKVGLKKKSIGSGMGYWGTVRDPHGNVIGLWSQR